MSYEQSYKKLISGKSSGLGAAVLRLLLAAAAQIYKIIIAIRNQLYDKNILKSYRVNAAVISVGNITAGGTGKTPLVISLCNKINLNYKCAILTRGYKTQATKTDEPAVLAENCPQAKVVINPNRVEAANLTINKFGANVLIMDDGFQHRRLKRDLDIVTIDATCPFGFGKIIPAGLLRESLDGLKRADAAVITRCNQISREELAKLKEKLKSLNPNMLIATSTHKPVCVKYQELSVIASDLSAIALAKAEAKQSQLIENPRLLRRCASRNDSIEQLKDKKVFAFCGIGNPDAFFNTIEKLGANLTGTKIYSDHYQYKDEDINEIHQLAEQKKADLILTTQKDFSKLKNEFAYLAIELEFVENEDKIIKLLENALAGKIWANDNNRK